jgi:hypothetical protein
MPSSLAYPCFAACYEQKDFTGADSPLPTLVPAGPTSRSALGPCEASTGGWCSAVDRIPSQPIPTAAGGATFGPRTGQAEIPPAGHGFGPSASSRNPKVHGHHKYHIVGYDASKKCWASVAYHIYEAGRRAI